MVGMEALHSLTAELHGGFLALAAVCIILTALAQIVMHFNESMPKSLVKAAMRSRGYLDATGYVAAIAGVLALPLSAYTGSGTWPMDALLDNAVVRNKIVLTVFATTLWASVASIRWRFGRSLWTCPSMAALYTILAMVAMGITATAGSLGAHLTKGESILDFMWNLIGINVLQDLLLSVDLAMIVSILCIIVIIAVLVVRKLSGINQEQLGPRKCTKWSKWDEPVISDEPEAKK
jgi:hypothetical protein